MKDRILLGEHSGDPIVLKADEVKLVQQDQDLFGSPQVDDFMIVT